MPVRSRRFFDPTPIALPSLYQQLWQVPVGRTARFSLVTMQNAVVTAIRFQLAIGTTTPQHVVHEEVVAGQSVAKFPYDMVLNPGDRLYGWAASGGALYVCGFGSLLLGAPE